MLGGGENVIVIRNDSSDGEWPWILLGVMPDPNVSRHVLTLLESSKVDGQGIEQAGIWLSEQSVVGYDGLFLRVRHGTSWNLNTHLDIAMVGGKEAWKWSTANFTSC